MSIWIGLALLAVVIVGAVIAWQRRSRPPATPPVEAPRAPPVEVPSVEAVAAEPAVVEAPPTVPPAPEPVEVAPAVIAPAVVAPPVAAAPAPAVVEPPVAPPAPAVVEPPVAPPAPIAESAPAQELRIEPPEPTTIQMPRTTAKPPPPLELVTQVLVLERATAAQWESAISIESVDAGSPFADSLAGSLQRQLPAQDGALFRARFEHGDALALAQANLVDLKERVERQAASRGAADPARDPAFAAWLDGAASAALAGQALAAWARGRHLGALDAESSELKSAIAALQARLDPEALRLLKAARQDLSRFLREAREGYAAAVRKPVFLERVTGACTEAGAMWSRLEARGEAIRTQLAAQADAPRLGEVQLERTLAALRALHEERRVHALGARLLGAIHGLRIALGAPRAAPGGGALEQAHERWRAAAGVERALLDRLVERVRTAKAPEYAGRGEFESNRAAARAAYDKLVVAGADATGVALEAARAAEVRGWLDGEADEFVLYVRVGPDGRIVEWRRAPIAREARAPDASRQATAGAAP
jgi:hypothetical protein